MDGCTEGHRARAEAILTDSARSHTRAAQELAVPVARAAASVIETLRGGGKVLLFGNGGSAADAQHIAAELEGRLRKDRPGLPALALTVNPSVLTALANDYGYEAVFARQIQSLGRRGDVAIGISTSGGSPSVIAALAAARSLGMITIGLAGGAGGPMAVHCDHLVRAPTTDTQRAQEIHITVGHAICELVESELFGE